MVAMWPAEWTRGVSELPEERWLRGSACTFVILSHWACHIKPTGHTYCFKDAGKFFIPTFMFQILFLWVHLCSPHRWILILPFEVFSREHFVGEVAPQLLCWGYLESGSASVVAAVSEVSTGAGLWASREGKRLTQCYWLSLVLDSVTLKPVVLTWDKLSKNQVV